MASEPIWTNWKVKCWRQGLKRGLVVSKRLIVAYIWLIVNLINLIRAS